MRRAAPALLLAAVTLAAYANTLANGFVWDDETIVVKNPLTRGWSALPKVLLSPDERPPYYRPLTRASYLVDYQVFGLDPRGFHAVNVALQVGCVLALYALARRLLERRRAALVAALLLALHPIGVEAVAFVSARNTLVALLFSLVSFTLWMDGVRRGSWPRILGSALSFLVALLGKEPAAMLLPILAGWTLLARSEAPPPRRAALLLAPHVVAAGVYAVLRTIALGAPVGAPHAGGGPMVGGLAERLALNAQTIPRYLGLVLFPRDLTIYRVLPASPSVAGLAGAWIAIAAAVAWIVRRGSLASRIGLLWLAASLLPIANLVALPTTTVMADRYFFIPAVGLWLVAADAWDRLWQRTDRRALIAACTAVLLAALAARTVLRNLDWRDDLTLARSAVHVEPRAAGARYNLGLALSERGDPVGARREWDATGRLDPRHALAHVGLGTLAAQAGDVATAERELREALRIEPDLAEAHLHLGKLYDQLGDAAGARREWETVLAREPAHAAALTELGALHAAGGDLDAAERLFRAALRSAPDMPEALFDMGMVCERTGRVAEAIGFYERFVGAARPDRAADAQRAAERVQQLRGRALAR